MKRHKKCIIIETVSDSRSSSSRSINGGSGSHSHNNNDMALNRINCWKLVGNSDILNWCNKHLVRKLLHFTFKSDFISDYDHQFFVSTTIWSNSNWTPSQRMVWKVFKFKWAYFIYGKLNRLRCEHKLARHCFVFSRHKESPIRSTEYASIIIVLIPIFISSKTATSARVYAFAYQTSNLIHSINCQHSSNYSFWKEIIRIKNCVDVNNFNSRVAYARTCTDMCGMWSQIMPYAYKTHTSLTWAPFSFLSDLPIRYTPTVAVLDRFQNKIENEHKL